MIWTRFDKLSPDKFIIASLYHNFHQRHSKEVEVVETSLHSNLSSESVSKLVNFVPGFIVYEITDIPELEN